MSHAESDRELRLALVLNGGVRLAVWISGVIHEVDRLRRASHGPPAEGPDDTEAYRTALGGRKARVDVIAGASAGGINGALLAAAIQGGTEGGPRPLRKDGRPLRDVWLELGDLSSLIRPTTEQEPPSLLAGDECFLPPLTDALGELLAPRAFRAPALSAPCASALDHPLYLYLTATELRSSRDAAFATSADTIEEPDHRVVFRFSADPSEPLEAPSAPDVMGVELPLDAGQADRLALAARSTSSFPVAFPPVDVRLQWNGGAAHQTYLVDGGVLDNQ